jgi:hypothetical protein
MSKTTRARYTLEFKLEAGRRELSVADANCGSPASPRTFNARYSDFRSA